MKCDWAGVSWFPEAVVNSYVEQAEDHGSPEHKPDNAADGVVDWRM